MPKLTPHEIDEIAGDDFFDSYGEALIRHTSGLDDEPPQGLHRGGWIECSRHRGERFPRNDRCFWCEQEEHDRAIQDYKYGHGYDDLSY